MVLESILAATILVSLVSLIGALVLIVKENIVNTILFVFVSFATGTLLGAAFLDLLPESLEKIPVESALGIALIGMLSFFIVEKIVAWHHHHAAHKGKREKPLGYLNLVGDAFHNFFDGIAIAAAFLASPQTGLLTTLVVVLHEIPQEIGDFSLLLYSGFSKTKAILFNLLSALVAVIGGLLFFFFSSSVSIENTSAMGLAFTAGMFIYIANADLFPELQKEVRVRRSILQLFFILLGAALILAITRFFA